MALTMKEAVDLLDNGDWVTMSVLTANLDKGTGGKLLHLPKCRLARNPAAKSSTAKPAAPKSPAEKLETSDKFVRQVELPNKNIITIHPPLITLINNQNVL